MPLLRGHHGFDDQFTQIPNSWLRDGRLSLKARGLMSLIMSHSEGWSLSIESIARQGQEGKDAIRSAVRELEKFGYLRRTQENSGKFGEAVWVTHDPADYPMAENPTTENPTPKNTITKEEQVKNNNHAQIEKLFDEFWNSYPRKLDKAKAFRAFKSALKRAKFEDILAGVIAYRNDPKRNPDFTKYPATWLNSESWENAAALPDTSLAERREREVARAYNYIQEMKAQEALASPPPKCEHGTSIVRCKICINK